MADKDNGGENGWKQALHFSVNVRALPPKGLQLQLKTDARERAALAKAHGLAAVTVFTAAFHLRPWKKQGVRVEGRIEAEIEQLCSITAEPLQSAICKQFIAYFVPESSKLAKLPEKSAGGELLLDAEGEDLPEIFSGGSIDAGLLAEEFFELEIDPYPRGTGAESAAAFAGEQAETEAAAGENAASAASPFAVLTHLKKH